MPDFIFDIPLLLAGSLIIGLLCLFAVTGLMLVQRYVLPWLDITAEDAEFTGAMMQSVMMFYGLAVALIAVSVWQTYSDTQKLVSGEATAIASLYRDVSSYPEAERRILQHELKGYVEYVITEAWPQQQLGVVPYGGVEHMNRLQAQLARFEPATEGQKLLHAEALRAYNHLIQARRLRLDAVHTGLPVVMWGVIICGAFIGLTTAFFFKIKDARLHNMLVILLAAFIGLVMFMIIALDRPFRGDLGLSPEPYQLIYDQLMTPKP